MQNMTIYGGRILLDSENLDVDLSEVTTIDFDSMTELLKIRNRFIQAGTKVELKNIPLRIRRIMQIFRVPISGG